jgi:hypothetical protein
MTIRLSFDDPAGFRDFLDTKRLSRSNFRATKKAAERGRTVVSKATRNLYTVKAAEIKSAHRLITRFGENGKASTATLWYSGSRLGLEKFSARARQVTLKGRSKSSRFGRKRRGVTVRVRKDRPRKLVQGGFLAQAKNGNEFIFQRRGLARLPIRRLLSLSVAEMVKHPDVNRQFSTMVNDFYPKELARLYNLELDRALG